MTISIWNYPTQKLNLSHRKPHNMWYIDVKYNITGTVHQISTYWNEISFLGRNLVFNFHSNHASHDSCVCVYLLLWAFVPLFWRLLKTFRAAVKQNTPHFYLSFVGNKTLQAVAKYSRLLIIPFETHTSSFFCVRNFKTIMKEGLLGSLGWVWKLLLSKVD